MTEQIKKCKDCVNYDETRVRQCICYNNECEPNEDATHCCEFDDRVNRIKSAIKELERTRDTRVFFPKDIAMVLAINSLKAWEEVLQELEKERDFFTSIRGEYGRGVVFANSRAIDIIKQKLAEIEEAG